MVWDLKYSYIAFLHSILDDQLSWSCHCNICIEKGTFSPHLKIQLSSELPVLGGEVRNEKEMSISVITVGTIFAAPAFFSMGRKMENSLGSCVRIPKTIFRFDDSPQKPEKL